MVGVKNCYRLRIQPEAAMTFGLALFGATKVGAVELPLDLVVGGYSMWTPPATVVRPGRTALARRQ